MFVQIRKRLDHEFFNLLTLLLSEADGSKPKKVHTDEDGNDFELEHLDTLEYNNEVYMAFFPAVSEDAQEGEPADIDLDDEEYGLIIMKVVEEDGEELLSTLDSDEELDLIYNQFMERLFADEEMED